MMSSANFNSATAVNGNVNPGWSISNTGGTTAVWRIYEGNTAPLLSSFLIPLTAASSNISKTYNGLSDSTPAYTYTNTITGATLAPNANLLGTATGYGTAINVGTYNASSGLYSNQQGYNVSLGTIGTLTINPATLTYTANAASRLFGAANPAFSGTVTGFVNGQSQGEVTTGTLNFSSLANSLSPAGSYLISGSGLTAINGNYIFVQANANNSALTINPVIPSVTPAVTPPAPSATPATIASTTPVTSPTTPAVVKLPNPYRQPYNDQLIVQLEALFINKWLHDSHDPDNHHWHNNDSWIDIENGGIRLPWHDQDSRT